MAVTHLSMFYESRSSLHVNNTNPSNNPNTDLKSIPKAAKIHYESGVVREVDGETLEAPNGKGFQTARFLIGRAMLDPDATVVPQ